MTAHQERTVFVFPIIDSQTPMKNDRFYAYLLAHESEQPNGRFRRQVGTIFDYLETYGFDADIHRVTERDYRLLAAIYEAYQGNWIPVRTPFGFNDLFRPRDPNLEKNRKGYGYRVRGAADDCRYDLTPALESLLADRGLVYELSPDTFLFEIIRDNLHIQYQHIIGGRRVCKIDLDTLK